MAIQLIAVTCTKCSKPMQLPEHVAELPCDARLCEECVKRLVEAQPAAVRDLTNIPKLV